MTGFHHQPVMLREVLTALDPQPGQWYLDGTLGGGAHAEAVLERNAPNGRLLGCDRDPEALGASTARLERFRDRIDLRLGDYADVGSWVPASQCRGALLDLGVSSPQLDTPARGFSFREDGPLDMRFNPATGHPAADWVNQAGADTLASIFRDYGDEPEARRIARAIEKERQHRPFATTRQLADFIARTIPRRTTAIHPATRCFQALRLVTNDEPGSLSRGLPALWNVLRPGGRLVVLTFHSGEDRIVKQFGQSLAKDYDIEGPVDIPELRHPRPPQLRWIGRKPQTPAPDELAANPRARSAKLRVMEKLPL